VAQGGGALTLTDPEAQYLAFFTLSIMAFGFVTLDSMMLADRPSMAPGPVVLTPPTYASGRVMRRFDL
jgi:hypothetical protein